MKAGLTTVVGQCTRSPHTAAKCRQNLQVDARPTASGCAMPALTGCYKPGMLFACKLHQIILETPVAPRRFCVQACGAWFFVEYGESPDG